MGEAARRGDYWRRKALPKGRPAHWALRVVARRADTIKHTPKATKRERSKAKRSVRHKYGYTRRQVGQIGAGRLQPEDSYWIDMQRAAEGVCA